MASKSPLVDRFNKLEMLYRDLIDVNSRHVHRTNDLLVQNEYLKEENKALEAKLEQCLKTMALAVIPEKRAPPMTALSKEATAATPGWGKQQPKREQRELEISISSANAPTKPVPANAPICPDCGALMSRKGGPCYVCPSCGSTSGCS